MSLRRDSFLCHRTALTLHGLEQPATTIYVNKEQGSKPAPEGITQEGINRAFKNGQRQSNYIFRYGGSRFVLISGKDTDKAGVVRSKGPQGEEIDTTDLERTLIDIVVRPAYAGGLKQVFSIYKQVASKIDVDHMIGLLQKVNYAYPYHQSIGFLLHRAGRPERDCRKFKDFGLEFDFFLDYGLKRPSYDENWRLYYPSHLR
jgi:predicted transcriptional regulator of viral defense system